MDCRRCVMSQGHDSELQTNTNGSTDALRGIDYAEWMAMPSPGPEPSPFGRPRSGFQPTTSLADLHRMHMVLRRPSALGKNRPLCSALHNGHFW